MIKEDGFYLSRKYFSLSYDRCNNAKVLNKRVIAGIEAPNIEKLFFR